MLGRRDSVSYVVVKIGGSTLTSNDTTLQDLVTLHKKGARPIVIHGGGNLVSDWMKQQGISPTFVGGLRVTDTYSLDLVTAVLSGLINKKLIAALSAMGVPAVGLCGVDGCILQANISDPALGMVGDISVVKTTLLEELVEAGYIPLVAPIGILRKDDGLLENQLLNINGDTAAGAIANALSAQALVFLTDVEGVLDTSGRLLRRINKQEARNLIESGTASGGMIPKLEAAIKALEQVSMAYIVDASKPHALLKAINHEALGTRID
jgi:acetylglutamate kinase